MNKIIFTVSLVSWGLIGACSNLPDGSSVSTAAAASPTTDTDGDGIPDASDNCVNVANKSQADSNGDGIGDACQAIASTTTTTASTTLDTDGDGIPDATDNCPYVYNPSQADSNGNGIGDACESTTTTPTTGAGCWKIDSSYTARSDSGVEMSGTFTSSTYNNMVITGIGANATGNNATGLYVEMKSLNVTTGQLDNDNITAYRYGDMASTSKGEQFIALPDNFMATGFGFGVSSNGANIESVRIVGISLNADGTMNSRNECIIYAGAYKCSTGVTLTGPAASRYMEYGEGDETTLLRGLGLGIQSNTVNALFARVSNLEYQTTCTN